MMPNPEIFSIQAYSPFRLFERADIYLRFHQSGHSSMNRNCIDGRLECGQTTVLSFEYCPCRDIRSIVNMGGNIIWPASKSLGDPCKSGHLFWHFSQSREFTLQTLLRPSKCVADWMSSARLAEFEWTNPDILEFSTTSIG